MGMWNEVTAMMACRSPRFYEVRSRSSVLVRLTGKWGWDGGSCNDGMNVALWIIFGSVGILSKNILTMC